MGRRMLARDGRRCRLTSYACRANPEAISECNSGDMASAVFASMLILTITHGVLVTKGVGSLDLGGRRGSHQATAPTVSQTASRIRLVQHPFPDFDVWNRPSLGVHYCMLPP